MPKHLHTLDEYYSGFGNKGLFESYFINPRLSLSDIKTFLLFFVLLTVLRLLIAGLHKNTKTGGKSIIQKLSDNSLLNRINKKYQITSPATVHKWKENVWFFLWHTFSFVYNFVSLLLMSGYLNNKNGWVKMCIKEPTGKWFFLVTPEEFAENKKGWPYMYTLDSINNFYILQIAYWVSSLLFLNFEIKRKDYYVFVLHHVSTIILLAYSHFLNFWRVGLGILILHDIVDVFLYASKAINYCINRAEILLSVCYALFVFSYFYFRIYIYFIYVVLPLSNTNIIREYTDGFVNSHQDVPGGTVLIVLLWVLMFMHVYWFILIIRMTYLFISKMAKNKPIQDIRSDDEESSDEGADENEMEETSHQKNK